MPEQLTQFLQLSSFRGPVCISTVTRLGYLAHHDRTQTAQNSICATWSNWTGLLWRCVAGRTQVVLGPQQPCRAELLKSHVHTGTRERNSAFA